MRVLKKKDGSLIKLAEFASLVNRKVTTIHMWFHKYTKSHCGREPSFDWMALEAKRLQDSTAVVACKTFETYHGELTAPQITEWIKEKYGEKKMVCRQTIYTRLEKYNSTMPKAVFYPKESKMDFAKRLVADGYIKNTTELLAGYKGRHRKTPTQKIDFVATRSIKVGTYEARKQAESADLQPGWLVARDAEYRQAIGRQRTRSNLF
jgi:hypothetical protein